MKISASKCISIKNCMNYDHNTNFGLFKFQSGNRKLYLNSPKGYSRKIINAQTDYTDNKEIFDLTWVDSQQEPLTSPPVSNILTFSFTPLSVSIMAV